LDNDKLIYQFVEAQIQQESALKKNVMEGGMYKIVYIFIWVIFNTVNTVNNNEKVKKTNVLLLFARRSARRKILRIVRLDGAKLYDKRFIYNVITYAYDFFRLCF